MERIVKSSRIVLALVHAAPAAVFLPPYLTAALYDVAATGDAATLLTHSGALFLAVLVAAVIAACDRSARHLTTVVVAISVIVFLVVYVRDGRPAGVMRRLATVDALAPLAIVSICAWRDRATVR